MCVRWQNSKNSLIRWNIRRWIPAQVCASIASNHVLVRKTFRATGVSRATREMSICRKCSKYTSGGVAHTYLLLSSQEITSERTAQKKTSWRRKTRVRFLIMYAHWRTYCGCERMHRLYLHTEEQWIRTRDNISFKKFHAYCFTWARHFVRSCCMRIN